MTLFIFCHLISNFLAFFITLLRNLQMHNMALQPPSLLAQCHLRYLRSIRPHWAWILQEQVASPIPFIVAHADAEPGLSSEWRACGEEMSSNFGILLLWRIVFVGVWVGLWVTGWLIGLVRQSHWANQSGSWTRWPHLCCGAECQSRRKSLYLGSWIEKIHVGHWQRKDQSI